MKQVKTNLNTGLKSENEEELRQKRIFMAWKSFLSICSYFIQIPPIGSFDKNLIVNNLAVILASCVSKIVTSDKDVIKDFEGHIQQTDLKKFVGYFNHPTEDIPNEKMLDILIGSDLDKPIPFSILSFVFKIMKSNCVMNNWAIIKHDFKDKQNYDHILHQLYQDETLKGLINYGQIKEPKSAHSILLELFKGDLMRISAKQRKLSFIMNRINILSNHSNIKVSKFEDNDEIKLDIDIPSLNHVEIQQLYPSRTNSVADNIILPHEFDLSSSISNSEYLSDNYDTKISPIYRICIGSKLCENTFIQEISLITMVSRKEDIKVIRDDSSHIIIIINKI